MRNFTFLGLLFAFCTSSMAQAPNDCVNAISINSNEFSGQTFTVAQGKGDISEVYGCGSLEHNSLWLKVTMTGTGTFGFDLIPLNPDLYIADYDFWVYNANYYVCGEEWDPNGELWVDTIRCNTMHPGEAGLENNHTGMNGTTTATHQGPGANGDSGYVRWLDVQEGEVYYIVIDGPYEVGSVDTGRMNEPIGFTLEPLGSSVTLGVEEQLLAEHSINIYPNPAKGAFTIDCGTTANVNGWSVEVVNMLGQIVYSNTMDSQQLTVTSPQLNTQGMYFVKVSDQFNNVVSVKRLVVK
ncbi:T9SS type A sorting domain-containing protein [Mangrovimonas xylaniphaga]|uniref:T9SS type A sorting domain-containing protein n=1 Tax=Mangrovimonas xylaniphaga TaxID=1645915 RepID=UPI0006B43642|nr:T9SS type A sorting domain-containing protein [Mangrovimonas xylaniphaga]